MTLKYLAMKVTELNPDQITELKQNYLCRLAEEGTFAQIVGRSYDEPSYGDLADADTIVPDDVIFREYDGTEFVEEDFTGCGPLPGIDFDEDNLDEKPWDYGKHFN